MKRELSVLAVIAALGWVNVARAADMAVKAPPMPPPVVAYNWTGCYLGGYVGGAVPNRSVNTADPQSTGGAFAPGTFYNSPNATAANGGLYNYDLGAGFIGGGTLGCNWQGASNWVVGVEGEGGYMRLTGSRVDPYSVVGFGSDTTSSTRIGDWYASVAGRVGYAWDRVLFYGKGGVGFTDVKGSILDSCSTAPCGAGLLNATGGNTQAFWVAGGGIEYAFNQAWSIKAEYLYLGLHKTFAVCGPGGGTATGSAFCANQSVDGIHTAKVGVNWHFNTGPGVVARY